MQFIPFCLFTIICGYSLVISAPVNQTPDTQEAKHQKATAIASRLLKELAGEHLPAHSQPQQQKQQQQEQTSNKDESKDTIIPVNRPAVEKVESHVAKPNNDQVDADANDDEDIDFMPTMDELYELYGDKYIQLADDEESSSEVNDDEYILPISTQQLMKYLDEQEESDENLVPVIHTPVIDDSLMTAEDHQQRRRRSIY